MDEYEQAIESAARDLYKVYCDEVATNSMPLVERDWDALQENQKRGWRAVATQLANVVANYAMVYGYNEPRDYKGLDQFITPPDHK